MTTENYESSGAPIFAPEVEPPPPPPSVRKGRNVGRGERAASIMLGGLLALGAVGLRRRSALGAGLGALGLALAGRGVTGRCPVYRATGIDTSQQSLPRLLRAARANGGVVLEQRLTVNRPGEKLYERWRRFDKLPEILEHIEAVHDLGNGRWHWVASGPLRTHLVEWDAEITDDRPGERIAWKSVPESKLENEGELRFAPAPGGRGTELAVRIVYRAPGGTLLSPLLAKLTNHQLREDLRRFKQWIEAGEVPTTDGQPHGHKRASRGADEKKKPRLGENVMKRVRNAPREQAQETA